MNRYGEVSKEINNRAYIENFYQHIEQSYTASTPCVAITDNVRFHKMSTTLEAFHIKRHVIPYLPSYSPFLNSIEERCRHGNGSEIFNYMSDGLATIIREDCDGIIPTRRPILEDP
ncbi:hypothetical protein RF11_03984 [Thelohanellus kitauei]|uniref:Tc1-like transposase DDE domain-containing protein n=1 Tax=Thelohanellus kitauei TaxID=669202 RepID=A0A0C2I6C5_THEKT|nr:hypothetical protein RF11_03984 [Thelohanellus kitauei]